MTVVPADGSDPLCRLRTALGKLVYQRNQVKRLTVQTEWTDCKHWEHLTGGTKAFSNGRIIPSHLFKLRSTELQVTEGTNQHTPSNSENCANFNNNSGEDAHTEQSTSLDDQVESDSVARKADPSHSDQKFDAHGDQHIDVAFLLDYLS
jgi:hypothetical protein